MVLLHQARASSERILDRLYQSLVTPPPKKPRTYHQKARRAYLKVAKQRRPSAKVRRKAVGQQLRYLRRNLKHIDGLVEQGAPLSALGTFWYRRLLVIHELYRQQWQMYQQRQRRIDHRIVSLSQPHVRPIVRGKAGARRVRCQNRPQLCVRLCPAGTIGLECFQRVHRPG